MPPKKSSKKASKKPEKEEETKTETEQETAAQSESGQPEVKAQPANPSQATTTQKAPESTTAAPTTQTQSNGTKEDGDDKGQAHGVVNLKGDTPQKDIMKLRQFRFGSNSSNVLDTASAKEMAEAEDKKKKDRLKKFGLPDPDDEAEKKKQRALKFGLPVEATPAEEEAKREERRKKFGILPENQGTAVDDEKIKARVARFGAVGNDDNKLGGGPRKQRKFN